MKKMRFPRSQNAIRYKSADTNKMKIGDMADEIMKLKTESFNSHVVNGKWKRPVGWPNLDQYWYQPSLDEVINNVASIHDNMYFTIDISSSMAKKLVIGNNLSDNEYNEAIKYVPLAFYIQLKGNVSPETVTIKSIGDPSGDWSESVPNGSVFFKYFPVNDENPFFIISIEIPAGYHFANFYFKDIYYCSSDEAFTFSTVEQENAFNICYAWNNPVIERINYFYNIFKQSEGNWYTTIHLERERFAATFVDQFLHHPMSWFKGALALQSAEFLDNQDYVEIWTYGYLEEFLAGFDPSESNFSNFPWKINFCFNFSNCISLEYLDIGKLKINWPILPNLFGTLYNCIKLKDIDFSGWTFNPKNPIKYPANLEFITGFSEGVNFDNLGAITEFAWGEEIDDFFSLYNWRSYFDPFGFCLFLYIDDRLRPSNLLWCEPYYLNHIEKLDLSNIDLSFVKGDFLNIEDHWSNSPEDLQIYVNVQQSSSHYPTDLPINYYGGYIFLETLLNCNFQGKLILGEINKNKLHPVYYSSSNSSSMYLQGYYYREDEQKKERRKSITTLSDYGNGIFIKTDVLKTFLDCLEPISDSTFTPSFNYEVYNINEIRSEIEEKGYRIPNSDVMDKNINPYFLNLVGYTS